MKTGAVRDFLFGTLRGRLIVGVAVVHAVMMTLFITDLTVRQRGLLLYHQQEDATTLAESLSVSAAIWISASDLAGLQELIEVQRPHPDLVFAIIADEGGRILAHTDTSRRGQFLLDLPTDARQAVLSKTPGLVDVAVPALLGGRHVGWTRVGIGRAAAEKRLAEITFQGGLYALAAIVIGSAIAWLIGRRITRRLYAVQETMTKVRTGDRTARSTIGGADEAATIASEFNALLDVVEEHGAALARSETKFRGLLWNIRAGVVAHGPDTRILFSNPMAQELLGLSEEQLLGRRAIDPVWHFLREDGSTMPLEEYPVNRALAGRGPLKDLVAGIHRPDREAATWVLVNTVLVPGESGEIGEVLVTFVDITAHRQTEATLRRMEWMLSDRQPVSVAAQFHEAAGKGYGDLTALNRSGGILAAVGNDLLADMMNEYQNLLETSGAVYEKNGDYAFGMFTSKWCRILDRASRRLCNTDDDVAALRSGRWLCHESCWTRCSKESIGKRAPVDIECSGGIRLYAVPIFAGAEVVGSINFGYGDPPRDPVRLGEIAALYQVEPEELRKEADSYDTRPSYVIGMAKKHLQATAKLIGELVGRKRAEEEFGRLNAELEQRVRERTAELAEKVQEPERANKLFVGRELRMAELKQRLRELEQGRQGG